MLLSFLSMLTLNYYNSVKIVLKTVGNISGKKEQKESWDRDRERGRMRGINEG